MSPKINFKIITPERITYSDEIEQVTIPTQDGEITVLPNHAPIVSLLKPGEMRIKKGDDIVLLAVSTGFVEIRKNSQVFILADTAERAEDIDVAKVEAAKARVQKMLQEKQNQNDVEFARLQSVLSREMARLKVVEKYRRYKK